MKIYVDDPASIGAVKEALGTLAKIQSANEEDIGFGIKVIKATLLLKDDEGGMDQLEEKIKEIEHVSQVEAGDITRL